MIIMIMRLKQHQEQEQDEEDFKDNDEDKKNWERQGDIWKENERKRYLNWIRNEKTSSGQRRY